MNNEFLSMKLHFIFIHERLQTSHPMFIHYIVIELKVKPQDLVKLIQQKAVPYKPHKVKFNNHKNA